MTATIDREEDLLWFREFVTESRWRFARTYVESYPHEYTLQRWGDADRFWRAILCIERWGVDGSTRDQVSLILLGWTLAATGKMPGNWTTTKRL